MERLAQLPRSELLELAAVGMRESRAVRDKGELMLARASPTDLHPSWKPYAFVQVMDNSTSFKHPYQAALFATYQRLNETGALTLADHVLMLLRGPAARGDETVQARRDHAKHLCGGAEHRRDALDADVAFDGRGCQQEEEEEDLRGSRQKEGCWSGFDAMIGSRNTTSS